MFSHREFCCALAVYWIGLPLAAGGHFVLGPASLAIVDHRISHSGVPVIDAWNATPGSLARG